MRLTDLFDKYRKGDKVTIRLGTVQDNVFRSNVDEQSYLHLLHLIENHVTDEPEMALLEEKIYENGVTEIQEIDEDTDTISNVVSFFIKKVGSHTKNNIRTQIIRQIFVYDKIDSRLSYVRSRRRKTFKIDKWKYHFSEVSNPKVNTYFEFEIENNTTDQLTLDQLEDAVKTITEKTSAIRNKYFVRSYLTSKLVKTNEYVRLWNRPRGLDWDNLKHVENAAVSSKIDGEHRAVVITDNGSGYITDSQWNVIECKFQLKVDVETQVESQTDEVEENDPSKKELAGVIAEAELYKNTIFIIDVLFYNGRDVRTEALSKRLEYAKIIAKSYIKDKKKHDLDMVVKKYVLPSSDYPTVFSRAKKVLSSKSDIPNDGLIFVSTNGYKNSIYKWKPVSHATVDFWLIIDDGKYNIKLFVSITRAAAQKGKKRLDERILRDKIDWENSQLLPYQFDKTPYVPKGEDGEQIRSYQVYECRYDLKKRRWIPMRLRTDKTEMFKDALKGGNFAGPNYFTTALSTYRYLKNPISTEAIQNDNTGKRYFTGIDRNVAEIKPMLNFHNWVKDQMYRDTVKQGDTVLELAGGRGGDMFKLEKRGVKEIFVVDVDSVAIQEANKRWANVRHDPSGPRLRTEVANLEKYHEPFTTKDGEAFDVVACQMAIHYFFKEELVFENFYSIVLNSLKSGGHFMFTVFNGDRVRKLVEGAGESGVTWLSKKKERMLQIKKTKEDTDSPFGNEIIAFLETIGEHPEYLVDLTWLKERIKKDFVVVKHETFEAMHTRWSGSLTENLARFSFLYDYVVLKKK